MTGAYVGADGEEPRKGEQGRERQETTRPVWERKEKGRATRSSSQVKVSFRLAQQITLCVPIREGGEGCTEEVATA